MKICKVIWIFTNYLWETGSWKMGVSFFCWVYITMEIIASQYQAAIANVTMSLPVKFQSHSIHSISMGAAAEVKGALPRQPKTCLLQHLACFVKAQQSFIKLLRAHNTVVTVSTARIPGHPSVSCSFHTNIQTFLFVMMFISFHDGLSSIIVSYTIIR